MGQKVLEAYMSSGDFQWVRLSKEIQVINDDGDMKMDKTKLAATLKKEQERDSTVVGLIDTKICRIKLHSNNKFSGIIWGGSRARVSGTWS